MKQSQRRKSHNHRAVKELSLCIHEIFGQFYRLLREEKPNHCKSKHVIAFRQLSYSKFYNLIHRSELLK